MTIQFATVVYIPHYVFLTFNPLFCNEQSFSPPCLGCYPKLSLCDHISFSCSSLNVPFWCVLCFNKITSELNWWWSYPVTKLWIFSVNYLYYFHHLPCLVQSKEFKEAAISMIASGGMKSQTWHRIQQ